MANKHKSSRLIQEMTKSEKRYFLLFSNQFSSSEKEYVQLFKIMEKKTDISDSQILELLGKSVSKKNLNTIKNYLYDKILDSLINYREKSDINQQITHAIFKINVLISKGLYEDARKRLNKIKKNPQFKNYLFKDYFFYTEHYLLKSSISFIPQMYNDVIELISEWQNEREFDDTTIKLNKIRYKACYIHHNHTNIIIRNNLFNKLLNKKILNNSHFTSSRIEFSINKTKAIIFDYILDFENSLKLNKAIFHNEYKKESPNEKQLIVAWYSYIKSLSRIPNKYNKFLTELKLLDHYSFSNKQMKITYKNSKYILIMDSVCLNKKTDLFSFYFPEIQKFLNIHKNISFIAQLRPQYTTYFAIGYLIKKDYQKSLEIISQWSLLEKTSDFTFKHTVITLECILYIELNNFQIAQSKLNALKYFKATINKGLKDQICSFFQKILTTKYNGVNPYETYQAFKLYLEDYQKKYYSYYLPLEIMIWLDNKLEEHKRIKD